MTKERREPYLRWFGWGGWGIWPGPGGWPVLLRFGKTDNERLEVRALHVAMESGITTDTLRSIPLGRVEAIANIPDIKEYGLKTLEKEAEGDPLHLYEETIRQYHNMIRRYPGIGPWDATLLGADWALGQHEERAAPARAPRLRFRVPTTKGKRPDRFYEHVAEAYSWLAVRGKNPAAELARRNDVPVTTVHRWTKEARRRGFLPPPGRGRAG